MAHLTVTYKDGKIEKELTFNNQKFTETMGKWDEGVRSTEGDGLTNKVEAVFKEHEQIESILDNVDVLSWGDDDDIEEALEELTYMEGE